MTALRITARNARFQQWRALLTNRTTRQRNGEFLVQGVRPLTLAVERGAALTAIITNADRALSSWARDLVDRVDAPRYLMSGDLIAELAERTDETEAVGVAALPADDLDRITPGGPVVVFDRPTSPGNIGTLIRSADAFGAAGVIVTGHAADPYDPRAVRASTGSLFALPVVRVPSHREVLEWAAAHEPLTVVGTDEGGDVDVDAYDLTGPTLLVVGNETAGMSAAWRAACDRTVRIPITGSASSLNAAEAATVVLYEARRQRARAGGTT